MNTPPESPSSDSRSFCPPRLAATAWLAWLLCACAPSAGATIHTRHVLIVAIDGARFSETLGDPTLAQMPRIGHDLVPLAAQVDEFRNLGLTITVPGMSALMTGTWQNLLNDGTERPHLPTLCEYLRKQKGVPDSLVRVVARKPKLDVLAASDHPDYGLAYAGVARAGFNNDVETYIEGRAELLRYRPTFMLLHLGDTDFFGHANDWPGYLHSIQVADSIVFDLWNTIQADPELAGTTTMFVTNDHGRHLDAYGGFQNHGDGCAGCRRIMMVMLGPDSKSGFLGPGFHDQRDVACTAAHLLGITTPYATGVVMDDLLLEPSQVLGVSPHASSTGTPRIEVFPNPTRGSVTVRLSRPLDPGGRLEVLDAAGRRVAWLRGEGGREWAWDGRRADGRRAPAGAYLVRVAGTQGGVPVRLVTIR